MNPKENYLIKFEIKAHDKKISLLFNENDDIKDKLNAFYKDNDLTPDQIKSLQSQILYNITSRISEMEGKISELNQNKKKIEDRKNKDKLREEKEKKEKINKEKENIEQFKKMLNDKSKKYKPLKDYGNKKMNDAGNRMFERFQKKHEEEEKEKLKIQEKYYQEAELKDATFHPKIGKSPQYCANRNNEDVVKRLMEYGIKKEEKLKKLENEYKKRDENLKECVFQPTINHNNDRYYQTNNDGVFKKLYDDYKIKKDKQEKNEDKSMEYTFKPDISNNIYNVNRPKETKRQFYERLTNYNCSKDRTLNKSQDATRESLSINTKNTTLRTKRKRKVQKSADNSEIINVKMEDKMALSLKDDLSDEDKEEEIKIKNKNKKNKLIKKKANEAFEKIKMKRYKEIFNQLDSDKDGFISSKKISLSAIDTNLMITLTPVFEELQVKGRDSLYQINFKQFCSLAEEKTGDKIFPDLSVDSSSDYEN